MISQDTGVSLDKVLVCCLYLTFSTKTKESSTPFLNKDYQFDCNNPWADPPLTCNDYEGQRAGMYNNTIPVANSGGRTDVEGCCWWGRGVIQTTGIW